MYLSFVALIPYTCVQVVLLLSPIHVSKFCCSYPLYMYPSFPALQNTEVI